MAAIQPVDVAATITAIGTVAALAIGARATRPRQTSPSPPPADAELILEPMTDPASTPSAIRERLAALEVRNADLADRVDELEDTVALLRALQITEEAVARPAAKRATRGAR